MDITHWRDGARQAGGSLPPHASTHSLVGGAEGGVSTTSTWGFRGSSHDARARWDRTRKLGTGDCGRGNGETTGPRDPLLPLGVSTWQPASIRRLICRCGRHLCQSLRQIHGGPLALKNGQAFDRSGRVWHWQNLGVVLVVVVLVVVVVLLLVVALVVVVVAATASVVQAQEQLLQQLQLLQLSLFVLNIMPEACFVHGTPRVTHFV